jgi:c(7)-type cytochrome triheme protein
MRTVSSITFCIKSTLCRVFVLLLWLPVTNAGEWKPLQSDGLHDPENTAIQWLQNPGDALSRLPSDSAGNRVDWMRALKDGYIQPRSGLRKNVAVEMLDSEILMNNTGSLPRVLFPHRQHTMWLDCGNCHDRIFKSKAGATPISMRKILEGQYCGVCHGAVSFPLTECNRCHSVPAEAQPAKR